MSSFGRPCTARLKLFSADSQCPSSFFRRRNGKRSAGRRVGTVATGLGPRAGQWVIDDDDGRVAGRIVVAEIRRISETLSKAGGSSARASHGPLALADLPSPSHAPQTSTSLGRRLFCWTVWTQNFAHTFASSPIPAFVGHPGRDSSVTFSRPSVCQLPTCVSTSNRLWRPLVVSGGFPGYSYQAVACKIWWRIVVRANPPSCCNLWKPRPDASTARSRLSPDAFGKTDFPSHYLFQPRRIVASRYSHAHYFCNELCITFFKKNVFRFTVMSFMHDRYRSIFAIVYHWWVIQNCNFACVCPNTKLGERLPLFHRRSTKFSFFF